MTPPERGSMVTSLPAQREPAALWRLASHHAHVEHAQQKDVRMPPAGIFQGFVGGASASNMVSRSTALHPKPCMMTPTKVFVSGHEGKGCAGTTAQSCSRKRLLHSTAAELIATSLLCLPVFCVTFSGHRTIPHALRSHDVCHALSGLCSQCPRQNCSTV